jgi:hypothetical protein
MSDNNRYRVGNRGHRHLLSKKSRQLPKRDRETTANTCSKEKKR